MANFFLGRWLRLGVSLIGQGFSGHSAAYVDCPEIDVQASADTALAGSASAHTATAVATPSDIAISVQSGCGD